MSLIDEHTTRRITAWEWPVRCLLLLPSFNSSPLTASCELGLRSEKETEAPEPRLTLARAQDPHSQTGHLWPRWQAGAVAPRSCLLTHKHTCS
jgi:hypothetical protein